MNERQRRILERVLLLFGLLMVTSWAQDFSSQLDRWLTLNRVREVRRMVALNQPASEELFRQRLAGLFLDPGNRGELRAVNLLARALLVEGRPRATRLLEAIGSLTPADAWKGTPLAEVRPDSQPSRQGQTFRLNPPKSKPEEAEVRAGLAPWWDRLKELSPEDFAAESSPKPAEPEEPAQPTGPPPPNQVRLPQVAIEAPPPEPTQVSLPRSEPVLELLRDGRLQEALEQTEAGLRPSSLPPATVLLKHYPAPERLYTLRLDNEGLSLVESEVGLQELLATKDRYLTQLRDRAPLDQASRQVYDWLIGPSQDKIRGQKAVLVLTSEALEDLPFAALKSRNEYLIEQLEVVILPDSSPLVARPNTRRLTSLQPAAPGLDGLRGAAQVQAPVTLSPEGSFIEVAGRTVPLEELDSFQWDAWLVSFPDCRRQGGSWSALWELCREQRVDSMVVNYWATPNGLIDSFHALLSHGIPPGRALQRLQTDLLSESKTSHPHHWAALGLVGEWR